MFLVSKDFQQLPQETVNNKIFYFFLGNINGIFLFDRVPFC